MRIWYHTHQLSESFTHDHLDFEIMYCVRGSYLFHYLSASGERTVQRINPKTMIFIPNNVQHGVEQASDPYHRYFLNLPVHQTMELLDSPFLLSPFQAFTVCAEKKSMVPHFLDATSSADSIESIFERMLQLDLLSDKYTSCAELHMRCLLGLLFCDLNQTYHDFFVASHVPKDHIVNEVRIYMDEHFDQPVTICDLARRYFIHPNYLSHRFTQQVGISPRKYLTNIRLANARKLLETSEDTVQSIALKVGFSDVNNFIQSFRCFFGTTPKQYRKKMLMEIKG